MRIFTTALAIVFLSSCSPLNRFTYDKYLQEHTLKIELKLNAYIPQKSLFSSHTFYSTLGFEHFGRVSDNGQKAVCLTITHEYDQTTDPPEPILFIDIDDDFTKLNPTSQTSRQFVSAQTSHRDGAAIKDESILNIDDDEAEDELVRTSTTTLNTMERTKQVYEIPVELFEQITKARELTFRQYIGNQAIDIIPTYGEKRTIASFYRSIIQK